MQSTQRLLRESRASTGFATAESPELDKLGIRYPSLPKSLSLILFLRIYNLLTNRDSKIDLEIASESKTISQQSAIFASEARQDGAAMVTIVVLTMTFLPAPSSQAFQVANFSHPRPTERASIALLPAVYGGYT